MPFLKSLWSGVKTIGKTLRKVGDNEHVQGLVRNFVPGGSAILDTYNKVTNVADKAYDAYKKIKHAFTEPAKPDSEKHNSNTSAATNTANTPKQLLQPIVPSYGIKPH
jgi:hypothetical protein